MTKSCGRECRCSFPKRKLSGVLAGILIVAAKPYRNDKNWLLTGDFAGAPVLIASLCASVHEFLYFPTEKVKQQDRIQDKEQRY